jgi:hypothetical protein
VGSSLRPSMNRHRWLSRLIASCCRVGRMCLAAYVVRRGCGCRLIGHCCVSFALRSETIVWDSFADRDLYCECSQVGFTNTIIININITANFAGQMSTINDNYIYMIVVHKIWSIDSFAGIA